MGLWVIAYQMPFSVHVVKFCDRNFVRPVYLLSHRLADVLSHFISSVILPDLSMCAGLFTELSVRLAVHLAKRYKLMKETLALSCLVFFFSFSSTRQHLRCYIKDNRDLFTQGRQ